ncbi:MAG: hypothetical protein WB919_02585 [Candidatus Sulfotelmatobacter sp.]
MLSSGARSALIAIGLSLLAPGFLVGQAERASCISRQPVAERYKVVALPLRPSSINQAGQVSGTTEAHRAGLWSMKSGLRELPLPAGFRNSEGIAVNNSGHVTGDVYDNIFSKHRAFIFANGRLTLLAGEQSRSYGISDSDEVVGESLLPGKKTTEPVSWDKSTIRPLGGCCGGSAKGVNKNGDVVGDSYDEAGRYQAFLWKPDHGLQTIGPPNRYSSAIAMNDRGHVISQAVSESFLYADGVLTRLEFSSLYPSQPRSMNNCDVIVGSYGPFSDADRAFVWEKSRGFRDLNTLIAPDSGWKLEAATSINDHGEIVGRGDYKDEDDTGFLLIPEP